MSMRTCHVCVALFHYFRRSYNAVIICLIHIVNSALTFPTEKNHTRRRLQKLAFRPFLQFGKQYRISGLTSLMIATLKYITRARAPIIPNGICGAWFIAVGSVYVRCIMQGALFTDIPSFDAKWNISYQGHDGHPLRPWWSSDNIDLWTLQDKRYVKLSSGHELADCDRFLTATWAKKSDLKSAITIKNARHLDLGIGLLS